MAIAQTILAQLGGNRFAAMTGAKNFVAGERSLMFSIGRGATNKANKVRVTLQANDTYVMHFFKARGINCDLIDLRSDLYADNLCPVFTGVTGLDCTL